MRLGAMQNLIKGIFGDDTPHEDLTEKDSFKSHRKDYGDHRSRKVSKNSVSNAGDGDHYFIFNSNIYRKYYREHSDHIVKPSFLEIE